LQRDDRSGVVVSKVISRGAAAKAGVKRGDIIIAVNGEKIDDSNIFRNKIAGTAPGSEVKLTLVRDGSQSEITVTLDEFKPEDAKLAPGQTPDETGSGNQNRKLGLNLGPVTPEAVKRLGLESGSEGLLVTDVDQNGPAAAAGIERGFVILEVNRKSVKSVEEVQAALEGSGDRPILLLIAVPGRTIYMTIKPE